MRQFKKTTNRERVKETPCSVDKTKIKKSIKAEAIQKEGLNSNQINGFLKNCPNFLGCFAQDELQHLSILSLPVFLIVNFDYAYSSGTHWIALRIDKRRLEIFDPLGFNTLRWPNIPYCLLNFLHKYSIRRHIRLSNEIQPFDSTLCGFYCIFFIFYRHNHTFSDCNKLFSDQLYKNDQILYYLFNKI